MPVGQSFDRAMPQALQNAKYVVVLWTEQSVKSEWGKAVAEETMRRGVLISVLPDDAVVPLEFRQVRTVSLVEWQRGEPHAGFDRLVDEIARVLSTARGEKAPENPRRHSTTVQAEVQTGEGNRRGSRWRMWIGRGVRFGALATALIILVLGVWESARWGLNELNVSVTLTRHSSLTSQLRVVRHSQHGAGWRQSCEWSRPLRHEREYLEWVEESWHRD